LLQISYLLIVKTQLTRSMEFTMKARDLARSTNNKKALAEVYYLTGLNHTFWGDYQVSYDNLFTALKLFEEVNDPVGVVRTLNGIGTVCYNQRNFTKAFYYYSTALKKARENHDIQNVANVLNNCALVYIEQNKKEEALKALTEAISINEKEGLLIRLGTNYINLGILQKSLKQYTSFRENYNKALNIFIEIGNTNNSALCYLVMSDYYNEQGKSDSAIFYAKRTYNEGVRNKLKEVILESSTTLHTIYKQINKTDSAYKFAIIQYQTKDSLNNEKSFSKQAQVEMEYTYEKKIRDEKIIEQRKNYIFLIILILAVSALTTTFFYLSRQWVKVKNISLEKDHLTKEIEYKNKELTINVMNLIKKNEFIVDLSEKLIDIEQQATEEKTKTDVLRLVGTLQKTPQDEIWEEFEIRFKQVYSNFYDKLRADFPDLTPNELKLCALLRLNLSTKEICELSGQRPSSLDVARYRLRKKLGLSNSQVNLVTYLSKY
jgi:tetratricopeptide (TPR) repeat protein